MDSKVLYGMWDEVSRRYRDVLTGHRVEIRILDSEEPAPQADSRRSWADFDRRVGAITRGARIPGGRMYASTDFYESAD